MIVMIQSLSAVSINTLIIASQRCVDYHDQHKLLVFSINESLMSDPFVVISHFPFHGCSVIVV